MAVKFISNGNILCAADSFMQHITELDKEGTTFTGVSKGKRFKLDGVKSFQIGNRWHHNRCSTLKVDFYFNGTPSSIALESLYAFLDEAYRTGYLRDTYKGLVGNCMGNEIAQEMPFNPCWDEIVTRGENSGHGGTWTTIFKNTGLRVVFSARDMAFRGYVERLIDITPEAIKSYPGIQRVVYAGTEYWEVK